MGHWWFAIVRNDDMQDAAIGYNGMTILAFWWMIDSILGWRYKAEFATSLGRDDCICFNAPMNVIYLHSHVRQIAFCVTNNNVKHESTNTLQWKLFPKAIPNYKVCDSENK